MKKETYKEMFKKLNNYIGKSVLVCWYNNGCYHADYVVLKKVVDYDYIVTNSFGTHFLSCSGAIKQIIDPNKEEVLYYAEKLPTPYTNCNQEEYYKRLALVFGQEHADKRKKEDEEIERRRALKEEEQKKQEKEASEYFKANELPKILEETSKFIKIESQEEWTSFCVNNSNELLGIKMVKMVRDMIFAIASGASFEEMEKTICCQKYHTSGFAMGYAIGILSDYTIYGNDIRVWWNRRYNISDDEQRVVNPCCLTIKKQKNN